jgi:hypothetical protein
MRNFKRSKLLKRKQKISNKNIYDYGTRSIAYNNIIDNSCYIIYHVCIYILSSV